MLFSLRSKAGVVLPDSEKRAQPRFTRRELLYAGSVGLLPGCHSRQADSPSIEFTRIPQADAGGREKNDIIEGIVKRPGAGQRIVLYARSGKWWVQPLANDPYTPLLQHDVPRPNAKWTNATHLGYEYAALLVESGYRPAAVIDRLPPPGGEIAAVAIVPGSARPPSPSIQFSGYEWRVRDAPSSRGGHNLYDPANAWTDKSGAMHLRIAKTAQDVTCAEVTLTRSLGYGTYRFTVADTSQLKSPFIFSMFTWDYSGGNPDHREMDIEIGSTVDPGLKNAQFVVQPYYVAANVSRFMAPAGRLLLSFRWEPGRVAFKAARSSPAGAVTAIADRVFMSGVPSPGIECVRMSLYVNRNSGILPRSGAEVVIERFEYLP